MESFGRQLIAASAPSVTGSGGTNSAESGWAPPPPRDISAALQEALALEPKYQPQLSLPLDSAVRAGEISVGMRNGAAHVLRCLKVWYDLPPDTLFNAINIMDRFLTKMKCQPKHLSCISVSAFHLSCTYTPGYIHMRGATQLVPDARDLTTISQCKCSASDVTRMEGIMQNKLATDLRNHCPVTPLTMLRLLHAAHATLVQSHAPDFEPTSLVQLTHRLEIVACDASAATFSPTELAMALLSADLQHDACRVHIHQAVLVHLHELCKISERRYGNCAEVVTVLLEQYESQTQTPHRQRLVWKLSNRTLRQLRPTDKLTTLLPTIDETRAPAMPMRTRHRLDSECSMGETDVDTDLETEPECDSSSDEEQMDYDEAFPPLPPPLHLKQEFKESSSPAPTRMAHQSPRKFPYPKYSIAAKKVSRLA